MSKYCFRIADINFQLEINHEIFINKHFRPFQTVQAEPDCYIEFLEKESIDFVEDIQQKRLFSNVGFDVFEERNCFVRQYVEQNLGRKPYAQGRISNDGRNATVEYLPDFEYAFSEITNSFSHIGFDELLMHKNRMILHASLIKTEYGGILFSGPSGVGKSTQAKLWEQYNKGEIINGDRPILGKVDGIWYAWGSPYAGSSVYHRATKVPIRVIIILGQGSVNHMEKTLPSIAFKRLYMQTTSNSWNRWYVNKVLDMVNILTNDIPVYQFTCTPEKEAVEVVENYLKG